MKLSEPQGRMSALVKFEVQLRGAVYQLQKQIQFLRHFSSECYLSLEYYRLYFWQNSRQLGESYRLFHQYFNIVGILQGSQHKTILFYACFVYVILCLQIHVPEYSIFHLILWESYKNQHAKFHLFLFSPLYSDILIKMEFYSYISSCKYEKRKKDQLN